MARSLVLARSRVATVPVTMKRCNTSSCRNHSQSESPLHRGPFMWPKQSLAITIVIAAAEKSKRVIAGGIAHPLRRPLLQMIRADDELQCGLKQRQAGEQRRAEASRGERNLNACLELPACEDSEIALALSQPFVSRVRHMDLVMGSALRHI